MQINTRVVLCSDVVGSVAKGQRRFCEKPPSRTTRAMEAMPNPTDFFSPADKRTPRLGTSTLPVSVTKTRTSGLPAQEDAEKKLNKIWTTPEGSLADLTNLSLPVTDPRTLDRLAHRTLFCQNSNIKSKKLLHIFRYHIYNF